MFFLTVAHHDVLKDFLAILFQNHRFHWPKQKSLQKTHVITN